MTIIEVYWQGTCSMWACRVLHNLCIRYQYTDLQSSVRCFTQGVGTLYLYYLQTKWSSIWDGLTIWVKPFSIMVQFPYDVCLVSNMWETLRTWSSSLTTIIVIFGVILVGSRVRSLFQTESTAQSRIAMKALHSKLSFQDGEQLSKWIFTDSTGPIL